MYAIIKINNKQYIAKKNIKIKIEKINLKLNEIFISNNILFLSNKKKIFIFKKSFLKKIFCIFRVVNQIKSKKVNIFKIKKRKNYKKNRNYKHLYTEIILEKFDLKFLKNKNYG